MKAVDKYTGIHVHKTCLLVYLYTFYPECFSMDRRDTHALHRGPMELCAVPFMFPQPVALILQIQFAHELVAGGLG